MAVIAGVIILGQSSSQNATAVVILPLVRVRQWQRATWFASTPPSQNAVTRIIWATDASANEPNRTTSTRTLTAGSGRLAYPASGLVSPAVRAVPLNFFTTQLLSLLAEGNYRSSLVCSLVIRKLIAVSTTSNCCVFNLTTCFDFRGSSSGQQCKIRRRYCVHSSITSTTNTTHHHLPA